jgi:hypothetical protein
VRLAGRITTNDDTVQAAAFPAIQSSEVTRETGIQNARFAPTRTPEMTPRE